MTLVIVARTVANLCDAVSLDKLQRAKAGCGPPRCSPAIPRPAGGERGDALTFAFALDRLHPDQAVYLCGPPLMLAGSRLRLLAAGVLAERIHLLEWIP
ncbi:hypothetical protein EV384_2054 [Micromonospora kangleipakensis]|uniref:Oxidoreductase FAD/NAD(P)-binding domain-containing protein n=1 Tax=Micromonospora kangleipakensis TaxID=1077942 RepID=A0A4Q8B7J7_9ACTN|nr:hypothetical protein EV384_2054 [Micromonospora kangleipakensis]